MKSLLFTAILSLRKRSEQILIKFAILLQVRLTHAQTFFRGVNVSNVAKFHAFINKVNNSTFFWSLTAGLVYEKHTQANDHLC